LFSRYNVEPITSDNKDFVELKRENYEWLHTTEQGYSAISFNEVAN